MSAGKLEQGLCWNLEDRGQEGSLFPSVEVPRGELRAGSHLESLWLGLGEGISLEEPQSRHRRSPGRRWPWLNSAGSRGETLVWF